MNVFLVFAFLFSVGAMAGWGLEVVFRRFFSKANPERKWINPGALTGPWLPLYGFGLCILFVLASLESYDLIESSFWNRLVLFLTMAVCMTAIEYIAGIACLRLGKMRLWDYRQEWGNVQGIICPKYSLAWAVLGAVYYVLIHPHILDALYWLSQNLVFSFVIGMFYGVFLMDVARTAKILQKVRAFASDHRTIVAYEQLKDRIRDFQERHLKKPVFWRSFWSERPLPEHMKEMLEDLENRLGK